MIENNPTNVLSGFETLLEEVEAVSAASSSRGLLALELAGVLDRAAANLFDDQLDRNTKPEQFHSHTHNRGDLT